VQETVRHFQFFFMFQPGTTGIHFVIQFLYSVHFSIKFSWSNIIPPKRKTTYLWLTCQLGKNRCFHDGSRKVFTTTSLHENPVTLLLPIFNIHFGKFNYAWSWRAIYNSILFSTNTHPMCYVSIGGILCGQCFYSNTCRHDKAIRICNNKNTKKSKHCNVPAAALLLF